ncbi:putative lipid-binding transport protein (Tim44 family) [Fluviicoccus keumensis]|uniref:Putative lipid-binding transport protein (Tim44 family) n=1 Tax=Fluviicoccus keumensis TaxID=1435465 RepID=A0A4Q7Z3W4_9GAMM|nr:TIM44-like domain-containing protein [Fluviicoccus keumensis]RZU44990.1 putative lipid-binding transport protein (Tim44 family) [Fluviicoccus keumensis]
MKMLWAFLAIMLTFTLTMETAEAKRMGGGKSFGRSYQTAPAPSRNSADAPSRQQQTMAGQPGQGSRKGLMGGLLGGLLVGGLFAALFAGGAFNGLQFMDILLIGVLAFIMVKLINAWRLRRNATPTAPQRPAPTQPVLAGTGSGPQVKVPSLFESMGGATASTTPVRASTPDIPFKLPLNFDTPAFLSSAKDNYRLLQDAWNRNDLTKLQQFAAPELFNELRNERAALTVAPQTEVLSLDAELGRATQMFGVAEISVRFSGRYRDVSEGVEEDFVDVWHLERDCTQDNTPWVITGIQSE